jgi:hypothetical protein
MERSCKIDRITNKTVLFYRIKGWKQFMSMYRSFALSQAY